METVLLIVILILALWAYISTRLAFTNWKDLRETRKALKETCQKLETAQCKNKCKYLANEILEAEFLEDK